MSHDQLGASSPTPEPNLEAITNRIIDRVRAAEAVVDKRVPKVRRRWTDQEASVPDPLSASVTRTPEQIREARSLRRVFYQLGNVYREYRSRTGAPVSPEVREAAYRFRREVNITSLVAVAASLDQLDTTW